MNRATRRRAERNLQQLKENRSHPAVKTAVTAVTNRAIGVLRREFGFGDKRIERFLNAMMDAPKGEDHDS